MHSKSRIQNRKVDWDFVQHLLAAESAREVDIRIAMVPQEVLDYYRLFGSRIERPGFVRR